MSWLGIIAVGIGGALGALARSIVGPAIQRRARSGFPWGTFAINLIACFAAGIVLRSGLGGIVGLALTMGFLGGFSTLSTVAFESIELAFDGKLAKGAGNLIATYACSILAAACGFALVGLFAA